MIFYNNKKRQITSTPTLSSINIYICFKLLGYMFMFERRFFFPLVPFLLIEKFLEILKLYFWCESLFYYYYYLRLEKGKTKNFDFEELCFF